MKLFSSAAVFSVSLLAFLVAFFISIYFLKKCLYLKNFINLKSHLIKYLRFYNSVSIFFLSIINFSLPIVHQIIIAKWRLVTMKIRLLLSNLLALSCSLSSNKDIIITQSLEIICIFMTA